MIFIHGQNLNGDAHGTHQQTQAHVMTGPLMTTDMEHMLLARFLGMELLAVDLLLESLKRPYCMYMHLSNQADSVANLLI